MKKVANQFNKIAEKYDSQRKSLIPVFDDFYGIATSSIQLENPIPHVLEIGTGTGLFTEMFLEKYPNAKMDLVDIAQDMLNIAKERLNGNKNLNFYLKNIANFEPKENKQYDAIITSLAIHHLPDKKKEQLYNKIGEWLKPNGIFVNAEMIAGETEYLNKMYEDWELQLAINSGLDNEEIRKAIDRMNLDIKAQVSKQLTWLKNAGFSHADCIYKAYSLGVLWAKK
jgi:tRNA (cmo5U34)-methyltransferase